MLSLQFSRTRSMGEPSFLTMEASHHGLKLTMKDSSKMMTDDSTRSVIKEMIESTTRDSEFFQANPPKQLPTFKAKEIEDGLILGKGQFGVVLEVKDIRQHRDKPKSLRSLLLSEDSRKNMTYPIVSTGELAKGPRRISVHSNLPQGNRARRPSVGFPTSPDVTILEPALTCMESRQPYSTDRRASMGSTPSTSALRQSSMKSKTPDSGPAFGGRIGLAASAEAVIEKRRVRLVRRTDEHAEPVPP